MNLQFKDFVQYERLHPSLSFCNRQVNFAENYSTTHAHDLEWARVAPNKIVAVDPECVWLLENNTKFHFSEFN